MSKKNKKNKKQQNKHQNQSLEKSNLNKETSEEKEIKKLEIEIQSLETRKESKQEKLKKDIEDIQRILEKDYKRFDYQPNQNELQNLSRNKSSQTKKFEPYKVPSYPLPEVGKLFEDSNRYYLEIEDYDELSKANEIAQHRYTDKPTKITVKSGETP